MSADDINDAIDILARIVREKKKLTPKILVVHRFTLGMVTNYKAIKTVPEIQIVMDMDGFGSQVFKTFYLSEIYLQRTSSIYGL